MKLLMDDVRKWKAVYRLLDHVSTEVYDCGTLCNSACCMTQKTGEEMGIYLFPGEHLLLQEFQTAGSGADNTAGGAVDNSAGSSADNTAGSNALPAAGRRTPGTAVSSAGRNMPEQNCRDWLEWEQQDPAEVGFPDSFQEPVYFVRCKTPPLCPRKWRPLQCRTFPLKPVITDTGVLELIWNDDDLPYECPIIRQNLPIHDDFYKATYTVWTHLLRDPRIMDLVLSWS